MLATFQACFFHHEVFCALLQIMLSWKTFQQMQTVGMAFSLRYLRAVFI